MQATMNRTSRASLFANFREAGILFFTIVLIIAISIRQPVFLKPDNINDILLNIAIMVIVASAQMMAIIIRGIDLSVASVIGLVAMSVGLIIRDTTDFPMGVAVLIGVGLGTCFGLINALVITKGKVPPIIATLGTMSVYRGLMPVLSKGEWVDSYRVPKSFLAITRTPIFGVPALVVYAILVAVLLYVFLKYTRLGRDIYALGSNPQAAVVAGVPVDRVKMIVFTLIGTLAGFGGVLWASRFGAVTSDTAIGFELSTVAACVIGGVNVYGGSGSIPGVVLGALLLGIITNALTITGISPFWRLTIQGFIILLAVVVDAEINRRLKKS